MVGSTSHFSHVARTLMAEHWWQVVAGRGWLKIFQAEIDVVSL
jgi:hypothetical protein